MAATKHPAEHPAQKLATRPGIQHQMQQKPETYSATQKPSGKLKDRVVVVSGGDSGIGRAVAVACAREGADIALCYLNEDRDAAQTKVLVEAEGRCCITLAGDVGREKFCQGFVKKALDTFGRIDVVINNAAEQFPQESLLDITEKQLEHTFRSNIFSMFFLTKAILPYLKKGAAIINTASVTAFRGSPQLLDYSSTKGAIVAFTRSLSGSLVKQGIRVNTVAPGPIWTPLIPSTFPPAKVKKFGRDVPMGRAGQPSEAAMAYVFLASDDASYITGQTIHVNGGEIVNA